jgi:hypothetical protein
VFVSSQPVDGETFLLITGPDGRALPTEAYDYVARYVSLEGEIERRGNLLIIAVDPQTMEVLP